MANNTKPYVRIQSNMTINVTAGLQCKDVTNADAHIPDRLKVNPAWPHATCLIRQGVGIYPSCIAEWNTVKALAKDKVLTIGEYLDDAEDDQQRALKQKVESGVQAMKKASLADIAK